MISLNTPFVRWIVYDYAMIKPHWIRQFLKFICHYWLTRGHIFYYKTSFRPVTHHESQIILCRNVIYSNYKEELVGHGGEQTQIWTLQSPHDNDKDSGYIPSFSMQIFRACARCKNTNISIRFKNQFTFDTYTFVWNFLQSYAFYL